MPDIAVLAPLWKCWRQENKEVVLRFPPGFPQVKNFCLASSYHVFDTPPSKGGIDYSNKTVHRSVIQLVKKLKTMERTSPIVWVNKCHVCLVPLGFACRKWSQVFNKPLD
jgi:hypothetical protein